MNQNNTTNTKISYYIINIYHYSYHSTEITYEINSYVARTTISQTVPDSASRTVHTGAYQRMDTQASTIDAVFDIAANDCSGDSHTGKTNCKWIITEDVRMIQPFLLPIIFHFYSVIQLPIGDSITTPSLYAVTTSSISNPVLKGKIITNGLPFIVQYHKQLILYQ